MTRQSPCASGIASMHDLPGIPGGPRRCCRAPRRLQQHARRLLHVGGRVQRRPLRPVLRPLAPGCARGGSGEPVGRHLRGLRAHGSGSIRPHDQLRAPPAVARGDPGAAPLVRGLRRGHPRPAVLDLLLCADPHAGRGRHEGLRPEDGDLRGPPDPGLTRDDSGLLHPGQLGRLRGQLRPPAGRPVPRRHRDPLLRRSPPGHGRSPGLRGDVPHGRLLRSRGPRHEPRRPGREHRVPRRPSRRRAPTPSPGSSNGSTRRWPTSRPPASRPGSSCTPHRVATSPRPVGTWIPRDTSRSRR